MESYEEERERQIRENAEFLASLGIEKLAPPESRAPRAKRTTGCERDDDDDDGDYAPRRDFGIRKRSKTVSYRDDDCYASMAPERKLTRGKSTPRTGRKARRENPGRRVIGGRIYDSTLGKTCHQCRQKTTDRKIACSNADCTQAMDYKCLLNRYNEDADIIDQLLWTCPKCRGICNCSFCMKKRGKLPTGQLAKFIKLNGIEAAKEAIMTDHISDTVLYAQPPCHHRQEWLDRVGSDGLVEEDDGDGHGSQDEHGDNDSSLPAKGGHQGIRDPMRKSQQLANSDVLQRLSTLAKDDLASSSSDEDDTVTGTPDDNHLHHSWAGWKKCPLDINFIILV